MSDMAKDVVVLLLFGFFALVIVQKVDDMTLPTLMFLLGVGIGLVIKENLVDG